MGRDLQSTRLSPAYKKQLSVAFILLLAFCQKSLGFELVLQDIFSTRVNEILVLFLQKAYEHDSNKNYNVAKHAILSVQTIRPYFKGKLRAAWESLESWSLEVSRTLRTAIPLPVMLCYSIIARTMAIDYGGVTGYKWYALSILIEVSFFAMLRPIEMFALRRFFINLPGNAASLGRSFAVLAIFDPKNRRFLGSRQFATVRSSQTTLWLSWFCEGLDDMDKLWPFSHSEFRSMLKSLGEMLGIGNWKVRPSSFRPGGCTFFFHQRS